MRAAVVALLLCLAAAGCGAATRSAPVAPKPPAHDWARFGWSASRTNAEPFATGITAANVGSLRRRQVRLDGTVDSSPIYLHDVRVGGRVRDVFFVTTTYGRTEALDADSGKVLWRYTPPGYSSWAGSAQITTATPVADRGRRFLYAATPGGDIVKLSVATGRPAWAVSITKRPTREKIAAALNLARGHVIATTGGYIGDAPPYQGHVAVIDAASGRLLHVWNALCSGRHELLVPSSCAASDAAIWGRAGAVVDPASGDLLVATGNAPWDGRTNWGDATLRLSPDATRLLGNYTPENTDELNRTDADLGSTSPVLLDERHLVQGGKDGKLRLLDVARMRGTEPHKGGELQVLPTPSGEDLFTAPAVWRHGGTTWLFAADNGATAAYRFHGGRLVQAWRAGRGGTSPVVAGGLLWVYGPAGGLAVYVPTSGRRVAVLPSGPGHWSSPIAVDGRVALPEGNANDHALGGVLDIWTLP